MRKGSLWLMMLAAGMMLAVAVACGGGTPDRSGESTASADRVGMLEKAASRRAEAMRQNLWAVVYGFQPRAYREVCQALEFAAAMTVAWELLGLPDNAKPVITEARVEGNWGYVDGYWESDGYQFDLGVAEGPTWVWRNDTWERHVTSEELAEAKESCAQ